MISRCLTRGQNVSLSPVSGKDHVVITDGRQMAWHLWNHLLALMKQADKLWLWPVLQWQPGAHCISSWILLCFNHTGAVSKKGEAVTRKYRFWRTYGSLRPAFPISCQRTWESLISEKAAGLFQDARWCVLQILCTLPANFTVTGCAGSRIAMHISSGQWERYCQELCCLWKMPALLANIEDLGNLSNVIASKQHEISIKLESEIKCQTVKKAVIICPFQSQGLVFKRHRDSWCTAIITQRKVTAKSMLFSAYVARLM